VVHEVRIPLAAIKNALGSLEGVVSGEGPRAVLAAASEEVDRVERLLGGLDRLAAPSEIDLTELDIVAELQRLRPVLERIPSGGHVTVGVSVAPSLPPVRANADCLRQVLVNLVRNAVEAMPEGGAVVVRAERDPAEGARCVRVVVEDTGPGVPDRLRGRLFEPLVTTKGEGHRGLGLAIVHSLVRQLGGEVRYEVVEPPSPGSPRVGSRFVVSLPAP
jgi:signal transduction histidine kinase